MGMGGNAIKSTRMYIISSYELRFIFIGVKSLILLVTLGVTFSIS